MVKLACTALLVAVVLEIDASDYCAICKQHTMCLYKEFGDKCSRRMYYGVNKQSDKNRIVDLHNKYRQYVAEGKEKRGDPGPQPSASNMNMLEWDDELARVAQRWADQCDFGHDKCRNVERWKWVGQNLYLAGIWRSNGAVPDDVQDWEEAISAFFNEVKFLNNKNVDTFNSYKSKNATGHYTQLVWAETTHVGCGYMSFMERRSGKEWFQKYYACNYGPGGNTVGKPVYKRGPPCSQCSSSTSCISGLCSSLPIIAIIIRNIIDKALRWIFPGSY